MKPYGLFSDLHCHPWSQFSTTGADGVNSRLCLILDELKRGAEDVRAAGGNTLVFAGDLFHQRGSIAPECFNPVYSTLALLADEFRILMIPGNHDLASKDTTVLGNAIQTLNELTGVSIATDANAGSLHTIGDQHVLLLPWVNNVNALKERLERIASTLIDVGKTDLIIHAGIDGVLSGVPAHGLPPSFLTGLGFKRVFAGHYHHHCVFEDGKVISIGATTHQTYSDIGTKAGFLLVYPDRVEYRASRAPSFVEITGADDPSEVPLIVDGNYVRVRGMKLTDKEVNELRSELIGYGAKGVSFSVERVTVTARTGAPIASPTTSLEQSVETYIDKQELSNGAAVKASAAEILREARSMSAT